MNTDFHVSFFRKWACKLAIKRRDDSQTWAGLSLRKLPSDCLAIQKLLVQCRPQVVIELGSQFGGSAAFIESFAGWAGIEQIISLDIADLPRPSMNRVTFITGDSGSPELAARVREMTGTRSCSLIVDSNHHAEHVDKELALFAPLVTPGQALIMEDTLVDVLNFKKFRQDGGPLRSLKKWLPQHPEFTPAGGIEPYTTTNFHGYWTRQKV